MTPERAREIRIHWMTQVSPGERSYDQMIEQAILAACREERLGCLYPALLCGDSCPPRPRERNGMTPEPRTIKVGATMSIVDADDYALVSRHTWNLTPSASTRHQRYATTGIWSGGKRKTVRMHRLIMGVTDPHVCVDHANGNTLDNRRANLRICTLSQNCANSVRYRNNKSGFKGVSREPKNNRNPWRAQIKSGGRKIYLGNFPTPEAAHAAYVAAARKHHGEFACAGSRT